MVEAISCREYTWARTFFTFSVSVVEITGTTRSGCGWSGSAMASARARYSLGSFAMTIAASAKTVPATIAIHFQRRRMAPNSSSTVYVRSIATLRESVAGALPGHPELHHVAVHLRHHVPV